jgi:hypothetical protein
MKDVSTLHLTPAAQAALSLSTSERAAFMFRDRFICHEEATRTMAHVHKLVRLPIKSRASGVLVYGVGGSGKTMIAEAVLRHYCDRPASSTDAGQRLVARVSMTGAHDARFLFGLALQALGCADVDRLTSRERRTWVQTIIAACGLRLLIVDEIQDITRGTLFQRNMLFDCLKWLMNETRINILALGTEDAQTTMAGNPHLNSRFKAIRVQKWKPDELLANFLAEFLRCLPLRERSALGTSAIMRYLVKSSEGILGRIVWQVSVAAALAVERGQESITAALLESAEEDLPRCLAEPSEATL